jgi:hypothetical protein
MLASAALSSKASVGTPATRAETKRRPFSMASGSAPAQLASDMVANAIHRMTIADRPANSLADVRNTARGAVRGALSEQRTRSIPHQGPGPQCLQWVEDGRSAWLSGVGCAKQPMRPLSPQHT